MHTFFDQLIDFLCEINIRELHHIWKYSNSMNTSICYSSKEMNVCILSYFIKEGKTRKMHRFFFATQVTCVRCYVCKYDSLTRRSLPSR